MGLSTLLADLAEHHPLLSLSSDFADHSRFTKGERIRMFSITIITGWWSSVIAVAILTRVGIANVSQPNAAEPQLAGCVPHRSKALPDLSIGWNLLQFGARYYCRAARVIPSPCAKLSTSLQSLPTFLFPSSNKHGVWISRGTNCGTWMS